MVFYLKFSGLGSFEESWFLPFCLTTNIILTRSSRIKQYTQFNVRERVMENEQPKYLGNVAISRRHRMKRGARKHCAVASNISETFRTRVVKLNIRYFTIQYKYGINIRIPLTPGKLLMYMLRYQ